MSSKIQQIEDFFSGAGIAVKNDGCGAYHGVHKDRQVRYLSNRQAIQVSDDNFDRWANSVEFEFDFHEAKDRRQFIKFLRGLQCTNMKK